MLVTSKSDSNKWALYLFLKGSGVELTRSEDFQAIGRLGSKNQLLGVVGYYSFNGNTCLMHMAGTGNWINRELLWAAFDYPFNQIGLVQVFGCVAADNDKALKLDMHLGFKHLTTIKDGWKIGTDMHVLTMRREDCRWLSIKQKLKVA